MVSQPNSCFKMLPGIRYILINDYRGSKNRIKIPTRPPLGPLEKMNHFNIISGSCIYIYESMSARNQNKEDINAAQLGFYSLNIWYVAAATMLPDPEYVFACNIVPLLFCILSSSFFDSISSWTFYGGTLLGHNLVWSIFSEKTLAPPLSNSKYESKYRHLIIHRTYFNSGSLSTHYSQATIQ